MELLSLKEAAEFAGKFISKNVTVSNISYLINYGKLKKISNNGSTLIDKVDLVNYYKSFYGSREIGWKEKLGEDLNWALSFDYLKESDTTKHVHRLHPYKGKFIPQLVEYFLDDHIDEFKNEVFFNKGDIVLDPFCGSGTTLVQANELGIHAIGIDISAFNALISNVKITKFDLIDLQKEINRLTKLLKNEFCDSVHINFENELNEYLNEYNKLHFPSPEYKIKVKNKEIDEKEYTCKHEQIVKGKFNTLLSKYNLELLQSKQQTFLEKWYLLPIRKEIDYLFDQIKNVENQQTKKVLTIILSRTIRSCRATTHADLATLIEPVRSTYYCSKHGKICKPLFSIISWWERYSQDTIHRFVMFNKHRTETFQYCLNANSEIVDIQSELMMKYPKFSQILEKRKINGVFSSPPYVGLIDYHEQHAYAYDLFGFERKDDLEIGALSKKQNKQAQLDYIIGISNVLNNCKKFLVDDFNVFLVANDKYNLYPQIAKESGMFIFNIYKRPVLNRTEKDKSAYSENIFHLKPL